MIHILLNIQTVQKDAKKKKLNEVRNFNDFASVFILTLFSPADGD